MLEMIRSETSRGVKFMLRAQSLGKSHGRQMEMCSLVASENNFLKVISGYE
jgi:hypothetical protein